MKLLLFAISFLLKEKIIKGWINRLNELNNSVNLGVKFKSKYLK